VEGRSIYTPPFLFKSVIIMHSKAANSPVTANDEPATSPKGRLIAEIDPVLAITALSANASLDSMISLRSVKEAQLVLAKALRSHNEILFALNLPSGCASEHSE
jgi:hypothetical protein